MPQLLPDYPGQRKRPRWAYLRSFLPIVASLLAFSFLLASYSLLSHFKSPAIKQHLGWQSWDIVQVERKNQNVVVINSTGEFNPSIPIDVWVSHGRSRDPREVGTDLPGSTSDTHDGA